MRSTLFHGLLWVLGFSLLACSELTPMDRKKIAAAQARQSSSRLGDPIDPTANGLEPPENRHSRELQKTAQQYRVAAGQAQGADRERYLQMAETLEAQSRAVRAQAW